MFVKHGIKKKDLNHQKNKDGERSLSTSQGLMGKNTGIPSKSQHVARGLSKRTVYTFEDIFYINKNPISLSTTVCLSHFF